MEIDSTRGFVVGSANRELQRARYAAFVQADREWSRLLHAQFGKDAGDVRYTKAGKGEAGSALRLAHDAFVAAGDEWRRGM